MRIEPTGDPKKDGALAEYALKFQESVDRIIQKEKEQWGKPRKINIQRTTKKINLQEYFNNVECAIIVPFFILLYIFWEIFGNKEIKENENEKEQFY